MFKTINGGIAPTKGSKYSACVDLYANEDVTIEVGTTAIIGLGVEIDLNALYRIWYVATTTPTQKPTWNSFQESHYIQLEPRSSLRAKGLISGTGIIDIDYPDELKLIAHNYTDSVFVIKKGAKIAQAMLCEHKSYLFGIESSNERTGGLGSTGE